MDQKCETKLVLHLGTSTSRARMQKKWLPHGASCRHANNNVRTRKLAKTGTCTSLS